MSSSIAKNTFFVTSAFVGQKILSFVYFTMIARQIGVENTGKYFFALSFTTIFVIFVDLGLTNVLVREAAKIKEKAQEYFSTILSVKILLGILSYLAAFLTINLLGYPLEIKHLVYLSALTMLFDSLHLSIYGVMRALGNLKYEAVGIIGSQLFTLVIGSFFLYTHQPLIYLILAFVIPSFINVCFAAIALYYRYKIKLRPKFNKEIFVYLGRIAIPFALAAIFARIYSYLDSIILSKLIGSEAVGLYSIAYKITFAFQFIPLALIAAIYPRFSEHFALDKNKLAYYFERSIKYLLIIVMPIALGIIILSEPIVIKIFKVQFLPSIAPLRILMISLIFSFVSFPIGAFLNACNKQATQTTITLFVLIINATLNFLLIPIIGLTGAAWAALVGNIFLVVIGYYFIPKITSISHKFIFKTFFQTLIAGLFMGLIVWFTNYYTNFYLAILTGALAYPLGLFIVRAIKNSEIKEALNLLKK